MKRIIQSISIICILSLILTTFCSCEKAKKPDNSFYGVVTVEEYNEISDIILSIKPDYPMDSSWIRYDDVKKDSDQLVSIGYKGLPVLIKIMNDHSAEEGFSYFDLSFWSAGVCAILRISPNHMSFSSNGKHYNPSDREALCHMWEKSNSDIPKLISSKMSSEEKIHQLRYYGIFAIPFILDEIEDGHSEYEPFFVEIGMHLSVPKYMEYMCEYNLSYNDIPISDRYTNIRLDISAEDFDYKVWLSENEEDLDNLFKFLDAYCAEYEAEGRRDR